MDIVQLKKQINSKTLDNFYIFVGEEIGLMNMYIKKMSSNVVRADEVKDIWPKVTAKTFNSPNVVYVVRDDKKFTTLDKVWTNLTSKIKSGTLVLCFSNLDKRAKFYKTFQSNIVTFEKMTEAQLLHYCKKKWPTVEDSIVKYFLFLCQYDYNRVENEMDKLNRLKQPITIQLLEDIIIPPKDSTSLTYVDAILKRDTVNAIYDVDVLIENGESGVMLLALLYTNFRNAVLVLGNKSGNHGVNSYVAKLLLDKLQYAPNEVLTALRIIQKYEKGIKTGVYDEKFAIKSATLELLCI